jgi:hypothetical protein
MKRRRKKKERTTLFYHEEVTSIDMTDSIDTTLGTWCGRHRPTS